MNPFRNVIRVYARNLRDALKDEIGILTPTGGKLPRAVYQEATIQRLHTQLPDDEAGYPRRARGSGGVHSPDRLARGLAPPLPEDRALDDWLKERFTENLLIIAPVGAGKSCLLESIALRIAEGLLDDAKWPESQPLPPAVPLLVSLTRWEWWTQQSGCGERSLNEYLSHAENEITEQPAALDAATMHRLRVDKKLILLIDGFDELPHRRDSLARQISDLKLRFALTSRPGHGEHVVVPDESSHHTLAELNGAAAEQFVRAYFRWVRLPHFESDTASKLFRDAQSGPAAPLLNRPLYVKAWCQYVHELVHEGRPPTKAPASLGDLAEQLYREFVRRRGLFEPLRSADPREHSVYRQARDALADWLGQLGTYSATRNFAPLKLTDAGADEELKGIIRDGSWSVAVGGASRSFDFKDVAIDAGLLIKNAHDEYQLLKLPVVDYLVGCWLGKDVIHHPDAPKRLIEVFRRWIWRPQLHDVLDYTFDRLWHGTQAQRRWATDLLSWAVDVGRHDVTRKPPFPESVQDDLVRPFALAVLRWHTLDPNADESHGARKATEELGPALAWLAIAGIGLPRLVNGPALSQNLLHCLVRGLIHQYEAADHAAREAWRRAIAVAAGRVAEDQAAGIVERWLLQHGAADDAARGAWWSAIEVAAGRVAEDQAVGVVERWFQQHGAADHAAKEIWRRAIAAAAGRVAEDQAAGVVERWLLQHDAASGVRQWAVVAAARHVAEDQAPGVVERWLQQHEAADDAARVAWRCAIEAAAIPTYSCQQRGCRSSRPLKWPSCGVKNRGWSTTSIVNSGRLWRRLPRNVLPSWVQMRGRRFACMTSDVRRSQIGPSSPTYRRSWRWRGIAM